MYHYHFKITVLSSDNGLYKEVAALEDVDALLQKSDRTMYETKHSGKRAYKFAE